MNLHLSKASRLSTVLGLSLDGSRLEGAVLRRDNGAFVVLNKFSAALSLDPLTNDPELVGREIRNHLQAAEVRERNCVLGLPPKWALTAHVEVPDLPEADVAGFLTLEAERGFPCDVHTLRVATSLCRTASGKKHALLVGVPNNHLSRMEQILRAAKLNPVSFSLGISALQPPVAEAGEGVLALSIGESHVALEVTCGGGIAALRAVEGALEIEGSSRSMRTDAVAREVRITLGQLPADLCQTVHSIRVFGAPDLARQLADELEIRLDSAGLKVEAVTKYRANDFEAQMPSNAEVCPSLSLAAQRLAGRPAPFELLPPKVSALRQLSSRYSSGKLRAGIGAAAVVVLIVGALFFYQQVGLWKAQAEWAGIRDKVTALNDTVDKINQYRPWFDEKVDGLRILREMTQAFPEDGAVTAKTVEIRDFKTVVCTGTAHSSQVLLQTIGKLRGMPQIQEVNLGPTRGQAPAVQFSFNFVWNDGGTSAN